jgi:hypothetical protein
MPTVLVSAYTEMVEMNTYCRQASFSSLPDSRTQLGSIVGLSITTSHSRPSSALRSLFRSPIRCSTEAGRSASRRPRLNTVTVCPRATA